jgi:hypothetical protein
LINGLFRLLICGLVRLARDQGIVYFSFIIIDNASLQGPEQVKMQHSCVSGLLENAVIQPISGLHIALTERLISLP